MRSCSLILSLAVILLMLVTMSSFAIAACPAPACSASAPACYAGLACDRNCISQPTQVYSKQPTQAEQKMVQVAPEGCWQINGDKNKYKWLLDITDIVMDKVAVRVEEKMLVVVAKKQVEEKREWRIALPENIEMKEIKGKINVEVKDTVLHLTISGPTSIYVLEEFIDKLKSNE